ncbi:hypothetical protein FP2506_18479 [Fulvimarina pelagi HTCC2506]|uniref:Uncharacterized protein n=1 Tax=Fulvimarina pelagi HTCC2506 TaxID=314231 RepID=Q0G0T7_9HYPH|nr:hypothetical protein FP2506_18479 [Fulvimarina pelagi HTCC2506]
MIAIGHSRCTHDFSAVPSASSLTVIVDHSFSEVTFCCRVHLAARRPIDVSLESYVGTTAIGSLTFAMDRSYKRPTSGRRYVRGFVARSEPPIRTGSRDYSTRRARMFRNCGKNP